jgi:glycogen phosphorylase
VTLAVDPICRTAVDTAVACSLRHGDDVFFFCSEFCRREYRRRHGLLHTNEAQHQRHIAYFSMEIAADARMPTYAGGLGVLAGDMLRGAADLRVPMIGVTLLHRHGYFSQQLEATGRQLESSAAWSPDQLLVPLAPVVPVPVGPRTVHVRAWRYDFVGTGGYVVPALFIDADLPDNDERDRRLTDALYGGDAEYRLAQEILLGVGGVRLLEALGYRGVRTVHLNEGHAALAAVELLRQNGWNAEHVRQRCVFTTHTPMQAGHDRFDWQLAGPLLQALAPRDVLQRFTGAECLNMTRLGLELSHRVNGVAFSHELVSETLFPGRDIRHVTNGVHSVTWTGSDFAQLYDRHLPHWRDDPSVLRMAGNLPRAEVWAAHASAKRALLDRVRTLAQRELSPDTLTVGFARRSTDYKRPDLVFHDIARLRDQGRGRLQLVFAGKAHPGDETGKAMIQRVFEFGRMLGNDVPVVYLPGYDLELGKLLTAGCDVWLNTPLRPLEASGTSGMKAAHNGVPSLSVLDGWWVEGCVEGVTGWAIGSNGGPHPVVTRSEADATDASSLYDALFTKVLPLFSGPRDRWVDVMRHAIALNASYFNAHRMVQQYLTMCWLKTVPA